MAYVSSQLVWSLLKLRLFFSSSVDGNDVVVCASTMAYVLACQDQPVPLLHVVHTYSQPGNAPKLPNRMTDIPLFMLPKL